MNKNLTNVEGPSDADLLAVEAEGVEVDAEVDWEALLPAPVESRESEDWDFDDALEDDRYSGDGIPSWSAFA